MCEYRVDSEGASPGAFIPLGGRTLIAFIKRSLPQANESETIQLTPAGGNMLRREGRKLCVDAGCGEAGSMKPGAEDPGLRRLTEHARGVIT